MDEKLRKAFDSLERSGYLNAIRETAMGFTAPFYWSASVGGQLRILHSGTTCYVDTGLRRIGVTANRVYQQYLEDLKNYSDVECQFGGSTVYPEKRIIDFDTTLDLATFDLPEVFVHAGHKSHHQPPHWPAKRIKRGELVIYGGYPGLLREVRPGEADFGFESFTWVLTDVSDLSLAMYVDFENLHWPLHEKERINEALGGISGGPVFRIIEQPLTRFELVGFIHEYLEMVETVRARHADHIRADGTIEPHRSTSREDQQA